MLLVLKRFRELQGKAPSPVCQYAATGKGKTGKAAPDRGPKKAREHRANTTHKVNRLLLSI
jgi:hypothetical protein